MKLNSKKNITFFFGVIDLNIIYMDTAVVTLSV